MSKKRVHQLAKELNVTTKELINLMNKQDIKDKKTMSGLSPEEETKIKSFFIKQEEKPKPPPKEKKPEKSEMKKQEERRADNRPSRDNRENRRPHGDNRNRPSNRQGDRPRYNQGDRGDRGSRGDRGERAGQEERTHRAGQGERTHRAGQGERTHRAGRDNRVQGDRGERGGRENRPQGDRQDNRQGAERESRQRENREIRENRPQGDRQREHHRQRDNRPPHPRDNRQVDRRENRGERPKDTGGERPPRERGDNRQTDRPPRERGERRDSAGTRPPGSGVPRQGDRPPGSGPPRQGDRPPGRRPPSTRPFENQRPSTPGRKTFTKPDSSAPKSSRQKQTAAEQAKRKQKLKPEDRRRHKNIILDENYVTATQRKKDKKKLAKKQEEARLLLEQETAKALENDIKTVEIGKHITVAGLAEKLNRTVQEIIMPLMKIGIMANVNQNIDFYTASKIAESFDIIVEPLDEVDILEEVFGAERSKVEDMQERPPVVVVMGHVDHGKTSLLDAIRSTQVTHLEAGGITQHIGAYQVSVGEKNITFLDTPGHEAFTAMRMRGAQVTDIAILVVAADDGVMPQTIEAINHARAADVEIMVAINKVDKPQANLDRVKQELSEYGIQPEDWGGSHICVPVSAKAKTGIQDLLENILLVAEVKELKANPNKRAKGTVIEANLDPQTGPVATVLIQEGTLNIGDPVVAGAAYGKIRLMLNHNLNKVAKGTPSMPVKVMGLSEVPKAGDMLYVAESATQAGQLAAEMMAKGREDALRPNTPKISLDDLFNQIKAGNVKELNIVIKADVQGSVEAVRNSLERLSNDEVRIRTIHGGVGQVTESDIMLAGASNAIIIAFNVRYDNAAKQIADAEKVDIRLYRVIYNAIEDISLAMKGLLDPIYEEKIIGHAEIRQLFKASGVSIAGCYVTDGKIQRNSSVRIIRDGIVVHEGELAALRRFKDDVREVSSGYECGLSFNKYNDLREGDRIEAYVMEEVAG